MELALSHPASTSRSPAAGTSAPPPPPHLDDDDTGVSAPWVQHVYVTCFMFLFFLVSANDFRSAAGLTINAIVFVYYTAMIHLQLVRHHHKHLHQVMLLLMIVATGIMLVSLATAVLVFQPDWRDLSGIAILAFFSVALVFVLVKLDDMGREDASPAKCEDAYSDLV